MGRVWQDGGAWCHRFRPPPHALTSPTCCTGSRCHGHSAAAASCMPPGALLQGEWPPVLSSQLLKLRFTSCLYEASVSPLASMRHHVSIITLVWLLVLCVPRDFIIIVIGVTVKLALQFTIQKVCGCCSGLYTTTLQVPTRN